MAFISSNGYLKRLKDVLFNNPSDGDVVTYSAADSEWENAPASGGGIPSGADGQVLGHVSGSPAYQSVAAALKNLLTTKGDLAIGGTSTPSRLAVGASGTVLSGGPLPIWQSLRALGIGKIVAQTYGDGASTVYTVTHNLNSTDVIVSFTDISSGTPPFAEVTTATWAAANANTITVTELSPPPLNGRRAIICG